ncbi:MAG: universal stress protein [Fusobacterium sp.]|nr:universal stress protein [Fusobacterium sp.]
MMEEKRITPEKALEKYNKEKRGKLKIYMGYSPGVGKTYTMLREANIRVKRGEEIYIAYLEPHDRKATLEQVGILKEISPLEIEYRGKVYKEVDVKAVIEKHPKTVLIDELAHTNIFGSKNKKRYEDVLEILEAGINVNTTLNIQHIESLNDIVQTITGIEVRERIPDKIVNLADEVEVVDISASNLTERLQRGEIYNLKTAASALKNFFRLGNLNALRELALRRIAQEVDDDLTEYMNDKEIKTNWHTTERVLVSISSSPRAGKVIRYGARIAQRYKCEFYVISIESKGFFNKGFSEDDWKVIKEHEELAKNLGADVFRLKGKNVPKKILEFAAEKRITQIVLGHSSRSLFTRLFKGSVINNIIEHSKGTEIRIVPWSKM